MAFSKDFIARCLIAFGGDKCPTELKDALERNDAKAVEIALVTVKAESDGLIDALQCYSLLVQLQEGAASEEPDTE